MRLPKVLPGADTPGWPIILQPQARDVAGAFLFGAVVLDAPERTEYDTATGNITWTLSRSALVDRLGGLIARNPQQHRTRGGTYTVIADPGVGLVTASYRLGTNVTGALQGVATGVLALGSVGTDPARYAQTLTLLRCDVLHLRDGLRVTP